MVTACRDAKSLSGFANTFQGLGIIVGTLCFVILGKRSFSMGRYPFVLLGLLLYLISFTLIGLDLPNESPFGNTHTLALIKPSNKAIVIVAKFLSGLGAGINQTQSVALIGLAFPDNTKAAFVYYTALMNLAKALNFFYSSHTPLYFHLVILAGINILGTIGFAIVDKEKMKTGINH